MSRSLLFLCFKMFERFRINLETAWKRFEQSRRQQGRLTASRGAPAPRCEKPDALPPALSPHNRRVGCSVLPHRGLYRQVLSQATVFCHVPPPPTRTARQKSPVCRCPSPPLLVLVSPPAVPRLPAAPTPRPRGRRPLPARSARADRRELRRKGRAAAGPRPHMTAAAMDGEPPAGTAGAGTGTGRRVLAGRVWVAGAAPPRSPAPGPPPRCPLSLPPAARGG